MGATISPDYYGILRKVDPTVCKCEFCGESRFVSWEEYNRCVEIKCVCGEDIWDVDFYPTEFRKVEAHLSYTSIRELLTLMGLPTEDKNGEFLYCGSLTVEQIVERIHLLNGTRYYTLMWDMASLAGKLGVDICYA